MPSSLPNTLIPSILDLCRCIDFLSKLRKVLLKLYYGGSFPSTEILEIIGLGRSLSNYKLKH